MWINLENSRDKISVVGVETALVSIAEVPKHLKKKRHFTKQKSSSMADEIERAALICARAKASIESMFEEVRMGKAISIEHADEIVQEISYSFMRNPHALINLARLKTADDYTYMHRWLSARLWLRFHIISIWMKTRHTKQAWPDCYLT